MHAAEHAAASVAARRQNVIGQLGQQYDGIFFDTYSEFYEDMRCGPHQVSLQPHHRGMVTSPGTHAAAPHF